MPHGLRYVSDDTPGITRHKKRRAIFVGLANGRGLKDPSALDRLLVTAMVRVGNDEYARSNQSFGLTTLRKRHVAVAGDQLRLRFKGKSGVAHDVALKDKRIARAIKRCQGLPEMI